MAWARNRRRIAWSLLALSVVVGTILLSSRSISANTAIGSLCFAERRSSRIHFWHPFQQFGPSWAGADIARRGQCACILEATRAGAPCPECGTFRGGTFRGGTQNTAMVRHS